MEGQLFARYLGVGHESRFSRRGCESRHSLARGLPTNKAEHLSHQFQTHFSTSSTGEQDPKLIC
jgi:hypothetical protein